MTKGRIDIAALRSHYQEEVNTTQRIAKAERLRKSLHYQNECGLPFALYLSKMQQMFTLFGENKESYSDAMKLRFLYDTINHPQLMTTRSTLQVGHIAWNAVSFTDACGHLATMVSKFPESQITKRNVSFVEGYRGRKGGHAKVTNNLVGIRTGNGEIYTGYYVDFFQLSKANQAAVQYKRKKVVKTVKGLEKNAKKPAGMSVKSIKVMKAKMKDQTITISAMRAKFDVATDDLVTDDAGNSFGGRKEKKKEKRQRPSMIPKKNDLHPFFVFGLIYGTESYILSTTEEGQ